MRLISVYTVYTEKVQSQGRVDCIVETRDFVYVFEFKLDGKADEALRQIEEKGYADVEGLMLSLDFYKDCLNLDPYQVASLYTGPVNLVHGDQDITASPQVSYRLKEIYQERAQLTIVEGAEHRFLSMDYRKARMDSAVQFLIKSLGESR